MSSVGSFNSEGQIKTDGGSSNTEGGEQKKRAKDRAMELAEKGVSGIEASDGIPNDLHLDIIDSNGIVQKKPDDDQSTEIMDDSTNRAQKKKAKAGLVWPVWASGVGAFLIAIIIIFMAAFKHKSRYHRPRRYPPPNQHLSNKPPSNAPGLNITAILQSCASGNKEFDYDWVSQKVALERIDLFELMELTDSPLSATSCSPVNIAALIVCDEVDRLHLEDNEAIQRFSIMTLYLSMGGNAWKQQWTIEFDECTFQGITCSRDNQDVIGLVLKNNNLQGSIPDAIGKLSKLTSMDLSGNKLEGSIPKSLKTLSMLRYLNLEGNKLTGAIPAMGGLNNLVQLDLSRNMLQGRVNHMLNSFSETKSRITFISLQNNKLNGFLPKEIGVLTNLRVLRLNENKISGSLPSELSNLSGLETFEAPINVLTGIIPAGLSRSLKSLLLDDNELSGTLPEDLYGLGDLEVLLLGRNRDIVGTISSKIGSLTSLRELAIDYCSITGTIPSELGSLSSQLSILNLAGNQLKGTIPTELASLSGLRPEDGGGGIKVANEQVTGPVASVLCDAFTMVELCVVPEDCKCCSQSDQPGCKASSK